MPSPASSLAKTGVLREHAEFALRILALGALVVAVLQVAGIFSDDAREALAPVVYTSSVDAKAVRTPLLTSIRRILSATSGNGTIHVLANRVPSDSTRALLSAANAAGIHVNWTDSTQRSAVAIEATPLIDPKGGVALRASAPNGSVLAFRDSLGLIDTVTVKAGGASLNVGRVAGSVQAVVGGTAALANVPMPPTIRRILLIASPGWEAKFTSAALEERGWNVDVRYALGKNVSVTQGAPSSADTARYAAVVALDSSALPHAAELRRYALTGGGIVIAGAAGSLRELGDLLPGRDGPLVRGIPGGLATNAPLSGISWRPISADSDAVVLSRVSRGKADTSARALTTNATVAARRYGAGRVVQLAYGEVWEWRMAGPDGSVEAHRQWWSNVVGLVAFAPSPANPIGSGASALPGAAAPYADMSARFGRATEMPGSRASERAGVSWETLLLATAVGALLLEWTSRRLRGAR